MKYLTWMTAIVVMGAWMWGCSTGNDTVRYTQPSTTSTTSGKRDPENPKTSKVVPRYTTPISARSATVAENDKVLEKKTLEQIKQIRKTEASKDNGLKKVIKSTVNYTVAQYLAKYPEAANPKFHDMSVGPYDVVDITVFGEPELSRENVRISADGYITFPLLGRLLIDRLTPSEIEKLIARRLIEEQIMLEAHVSVTVREYRSKTYKVLGSVKSPGTYPLRARERVLDAISRAGGIDRRQGGKQAILIRNLEPDNHEKKIAIRIDLSTLLKGGDTQSDLLLMHQDLLYIPKAESFYIIGQVKQPGSYPYLEGEITLVEAISMAGGFTPIAARNRTRIVRMENGMEKVINIKVDDITGAGQKAKDVAILPGDVIVIPESFF